MIDPVSTLELARLSAAPGALRSDDPSRELGEALGEFEAYFVGEMLRRASRASEGQGGLLQGGPAGRTWRELFFEEIGRLVLRRGGIGLADSLTDAARRRAPEGEGAS